MCIYSQQTIHRYVPTTFSLFFQKTKIFKIYIKYTFLHCFLKKSVCKSQKNHLKKIVEVFWRRTKKSLLMKLWLLHCVFYLFPLLHLFIFKRQNYKKFSKNSLFGWIWDKNEEKRKQKKAGLKETGIEWGCWMLLMLMREKRMSMQIKEREEKNTLRSSVVSFDQF